MTTLCRDCKGGCGCYPGGALNVTHEVSSKTLIINAHIRCPKCGQKPVITQRDHAHIGPDYVCLTLKCCMIGNLYLKVE